VAPPREVDRPVELAQEAGEAAVLEHPVRASGRRADAKVKRVGAGARRLS
jgi:hypothetical protein